MLIDKWVNNELLQLAFYYVKMIVNEYFFLFLNSIENVDQIIYTLLSNCSALFNI